MEQAAVNEPAALPEFDLVRDRVRILLYLPASCYFASYDIYETFTCMPLKNMVVTCVPLKKLLAPVCHRPTFLYPLCHSIHNPLEIHR
jgi:hypothetical protein